MGDCPDNNVGNSWRALEGAGNAGQNVINGVVSGGLRVESRAFGANDNCGTVSCYKSGVITLNQDGSPGVLAVGISHEYAHSTEAAAGTIWAAADNELRAWDLSRPVFNALQSPFSDQAGARFGADFRTLATPGGRAVNRGIWACEAGRKTAGQDVASCHH